ncbi:MAG TPA: hypothetical protein VFL90_20310 [Methylomirabilota bacterium]|nr:hypothetical protein [Methylomirabilota bacterium]
MSVFQLEGYDTSRHAHRQPAWWALYLIGLLLVGGIGLLERHVPVGPVRTVLECCVVIIAFGLMLFWRHCNRARWM